MAPLVADQSVLGVDLGASRAKAGLFTLDGHPLATASSAVAALWWQAVQQAIQACLRSATNQRVAAVCVGGQGPSLVAVDAQGRTVYPPIGFADGRAHSQALSASDRLGRSVSERSSYLPRAMWIRDHEPVAYQNTRWFLQAWDFIVFQLTGVAAATAPPVEAYIPWRSDELEKVGLDPARFPPVVVSGSVVGPIGPDVARATGLRTGTPVVAGGNDFLLGTVGVAGARKGIAQSQGGTTGALTLCWDHPLRGPFVAWSIPSPVREELVNSGGPLTTAGAALDWFCATVLGNANVDDAAAKAAEAPAGADGVIFLPYLAGEELTFGAGVRGALAGLSLRHRASHLTRAVLEGIAFAARAILESLRTAGGLVSEVVSYGGQVRSPQWNQIKADIWGVPLAIPQVMDAGILGAAAIAAAGVGAYHSLAEASERMAHVGQRFFPDPQKSEVYDAALHAFMSLLPAPRHSIAHPSVRPPEPLHA